MRNKLISLASAVILLIAVFTGCYKGENIGSTGAIKGVVVLSDGVTTMPGATVNFIAGGSVSTVQTDVNGAFMIKLNAGRSYAIIAEASGMKSGTIMSPRVIANQIIDVGNLVLKGVGNLQGRVTDTNGQVISGARVQIKDASGNIVAEGLTDSSGKILIERIPEGIYNVSITSADGSLNLTIPNVVISAQSTKDLGTVVVIPSTATTVAVSGSVLSNSNVALSSVKVEFKNASTFDVVRTINTGVGGGFSTTVIPGTYNITFSLAGYYSLTLLGIEITNNKELPTVILTSTSTPTGGIKGQIIANGVPQDGVRITVLDAEGRVVGTGITVLLGNGLFTISNLPEGNYTVRFESPAIQTFERQVQITAGVITELGVINVTPSAGIKGTLKDQNGQVVAGATVVLKDSAGNVIATTTTDVTGSFRFENVAAGSGYKIEVSKEGYDTKIFDNAGAGYSVSIGVYTDINNGAGNLTFYKSIGNIEITAKDKITNAVVSGIVLSIDNDSQTTNANGKVLFVNKASHRSYTVVSTANAIYESASLSTGNLSTNTTLSKEIYLDRKLATISGSNIKLGDTNELANAGSVKICNATLLPEVNGERCIVVGIQNGSVTIPNLPFGTGYTITLIYSNDYNTISRSNITISASSLSLADLLGVALVFEPNVGVAKSGIQVTVRDENNNPLSEITVKIGNTVFRTNASGVINTGLTLDYNPNALPVIINENSAANWKYASTTLSIAPNKVNQIITQTVSLTRKTATVSVYVKRMDNNANLSGATVTIGSYNATTDINGIATFSNLKYDDYTVSASLIGYLTGSLSYKNDGTTNPTIKLLVDTGTTFKITATGVQNGDILTVKSGSNVVKTVTATGNNFDITGLPAGTYTVVASRTFYNPIESGSVTLGPDGNVNFTFNPSGDGTSPGSRKRGSLTGTVVLNEPAGETITAVSVSLSGDGTGTTTPNASGVFTFSSLYEGNYTITVTYTNYVTATKNITVVGNQSAGTITLNPNYGTVNFAITGIGGSSAGAVISFRGANYNANASGNLTVSNVKAGSYSYSVSKPDFVGISTTNFALAAGENKNITGNIYAYATIKGFVRTGTTTFPNALVAITGTTNVNPTLNSSAYFEVKVPAGNYTITISNLGFGYDNLTDSFTVAAGGVYDLQVNWDPEDDGATDIGAGTYLQPYRLTVNAYGDGSALTGTVTVGGTAYTLIGGSVSNIVVQKNTNYTITLSNLPLGYTPQSVNKTIVNKNETVTFNLTPAIITVSANTPFATFRIYNSANQLVDTKTPGSYYIEPGQYKVEARAPGYISQTSGYQTAGQVTFNFTLQQYATVTGTIKDSYGNPISGVKVELSNGLYAYTDAAGNFTISNVVPGNYTYSITKENYQTITGSQTFNSGNNTLGGGSAITMVGLGSVVGEARSMAYCDTAVKPKVLVACNATGARYNPSIPLSGAYVRVYNQADVMVASGVTDGLGKFDIRVAIGTNYSIRVEKTGYVTGSKSGIRIEGIGSNAGIIYLPDSQLKPADGEWTNGIVIGNIVNAVNGRKITDRTITVEVRIGGANGAIVNKLNGLPAVVNTSTGSFQIGGTGAGDALIPGSFYTLVLRDDTNYYQEAAYDMIIIDGTTNVGTIAMTPKLPNGEMRITLRWQSDDYDYVNNRALNYWTNDLDGHLVGPAGSNFHIWYGGMTNAYAKQDIDDTVWCTRNGETITIFNTANLPDGTYSYTIHNYAKPVTTNYLSANSNAVVVIYDSKGILAMQEIEPNDGWASNGWKVFEITKTSAGITVRTINQKRDIATWGGDGSGVRFTGTYDEKVISQAISSKPKN